MLAPAASASPALDVREETDSLHWDHLLAKLGGHPLQSSLWGDARKQADGIEDRRLLIRGEGEPDRLMRIELRSVPLLGNLGWVPRGPVGDRIDDTRLVRNLPKSYGLGLLVTDRYEEVLEAGHTAALPRTQWIDLSAGFGKLWESFEPSFRQGVRRSGKSSVIVREARAQIEVSRFFEICSDVSAAKGFDLPATLPLMQHLFANSSDERAVAARLLVACIGREIAGGVFLIRCGRSLHFFWGGSDRQFSKARVSEALHWEAIRWGVQCGCTRYDLEGLDKVKNAGTYAFKKKFGGREVVLGGKEYVCVRPWGKLAAFWLSRG